MMQYTFELSDSAAQRIANPLCQINGHWEIGEGDEVSSLNPTTGEPIGTFRCASPAQVDAAIAAARHAFDHGPWRAYTPRDRAAVLRKLVALMDEATRDLTEIIVADVGTPVSLATTMQVRGPRNSLAWFAEAAERGPDGWYQRAPLPHVNTGGPASSSLLRREPIGVVAAIATWNFPLTTMVWKMCGALAAGCTVVLQPSVKAVHSTLALWRLIDQLNLPPGVVNLVFGDAEAGQVLSTSPDVDLVSFTGSLKVGGLIMAQAAPTIKKVVLELGGKSPNIILPGTPLEDVVKLSIDRLMGNAGQRCGATSRILVHSTQVEDFTARAASLLAHSRIGDPRDPATEIGPLIDHGHRASVQRYIDRAKADGGTVVAGGQPLPADLPGGAFLAPHLFAGLGNDSELCQEEQFGPVGAILPYEDIDEAVAIANASRFGLNAMVFGETEQAIGVATRIRAGTVTVNGRGAAQLEASWGGYGQSGLGREGGDEGFREFFELKHIQWAMR